MFVGAFFVRCVCLEYVSHGFFMYVISESFCVFFVSLCVLCARVRRKRAPQIAPHACVVRTDMFFRVHSLCVLVKISS